MRSRFRQHIARRCGELSCTSADGAPVAAWGLLDRCQPRAPSLLRQGFLRSVRRPSAWRHLGREPGCPGFPAEDLPRLYVVPLGKLRACGWRRGDRRGARGREGGKEGPGLPLLVPDANRSRQLHPLPGEGRPDPPGPTPLPDPGLRKSPPSLEVSAGSPARPGPICASRCRPGRAET